VRTNRSATPFACGARNGVRRISIPSLRNTSPKLPLNFWSRSRMRKAERLRTSCEGPRQMPCPLRRPLRARIRRASCNMDTTAPELDEEKYIQPLEPDRLDGEKVDREHALPVRTQELTPSHPARADWSETRGSQPRAHRRRRNRESEAPQLANNALIAPPWVVASEAQDQFSDLTAHRRPTGSRLRQSRASRVDDISKSCRATISYNAYLMANRLIGQIHTRLKNA
jgi:hypothetical protein